MKKFGAKNKREKEQSAEEKLKIAVSVLLSANVSEGASALVCSRPYGVLTREFFAKIGCYTTEIGGTKHEVKTLRADEKLSRTDFVVGPLAAYSGGFFDFVVLFDVVGALSPAELNMFFAHIQPFGRLIVIDTACAKKTDELKTLFSGIRPDVEYDGEFTVFSGIRVTLPARNGG